MYRIGSSSDIHALVNDRVLILGGVIVDKTIGCQAHSDGDVLIHAIVEALLGAMGLGDLGEHFSDKDPRYKDISSTYFIGVIKDLLNEKGYVIVNIDTSIILENIRLESYKKAIRDNLASWLEIPSDAINIKAGTNEKMDAIGRGEAIMATATVLIRKR
jgi:2-C-methyl-D-erythritol 2,4-cyclodiphosphate synthase